MAKAKARKASKARRVSRASSVPTRAEVIRENEPFTVDVTAGTANTSVKLFRDGVAAGQQLVVSGKVSFPFPAGLPLGTYQFTAKGVNAEGESAATPPTALTLGGALPGVPGGIFIRFGAS